MIRKQNINALEVELGVVLTLEHLQASAIRAKEQFAEGNRAGANNYLRRQYEYWASIESAMRWAIELTKQGLTRKVLANATCNPIDCESNQTGRTSDLGQSNPQGSILERGDKLRGKSAWTNATRRIDRNPGSSV